MHIDKDIPLPNTKTYQKYPWQNMEVGDSIVVAGKNPHSVALLASLRYGKKFKVFKTDTGFRCWRIE